MTAQRLGYLAGRAAGITLYAFVVGVAAYIALAVLGGMIGVVIYHARRAATSGWFWSGW